MFYQWFFKFRGLLVLAIDGDDHFLGYIVCLYAEIFYGHREAGFSQWFAVFHRNAAVSAYFFGDTMQGEVTFYLYRVSAIFGKIDSTNIGDAAFEVAAGVLVALHVLGIKMVLHFGHFEAKAFYQQAEAKSAIIAQAAAHFIIDGFHIFICRRLKNHLAIAGAKNLLCGCGPVLKNG